MAEPGPKRSRGRLVMKPFVWASFAAKGMGSLLLMPARARGRSRGGRRLPLASLSGAFLHGSPHQPVSGTLSNAEVNDGQPSTSGRAEPVFAQPLEAFVAWAASLQLPWQQQQECQQQQESSSHGSATEGTIMLDNSSTFPLVMSSPLARPRPLLLSRPSAAAMQLQQHQTSSQHQQQEQQQEQEQQQLLTVGSRMWGNWWDGRGLLHVKIYDFAVYVDGPSAHAQLAGGPDGKRSLLSRALRRKQRRTARQAQQSAAIAAMAPSEAAGSTAVAREVGPLPSSCPAQRCQSASTAAMDAAADANSGAKQQRRQRLRRGRKGSSKAASAAGEAAAAAPLALVQPGLAARLVFGGAAGQQMVPMSLVLRASRDIPLATLASEYEKVLQRRLAKVGGDPSDPALSALLATFAPARVPRLIRSGPASVAKGTVMTFERGRDGGLTARVGPHVLGVFQSPKLCEALFDLYLGDNPVSKKAKAAASDTLYRLMRSPGELYRPHAASERISCSGPHLTACVLEVKD